MSFSPAKSFWAAPVLFAVCVAALFATWLAMEPSALRQAFDQDGRSVFELATIPFYAAIIPLVWWKCPFTGSRRRRALLCAAVSCVAFMAVAKELDWHLAAMQHLFPSVVGADGSVHGLVKPDGSPLTGTPFKMRFLTNGAAPVAAKACVLFYFGAFFGVFAALLAYYAVPLFKGFFRLHPAAWSMCFFGGSGVMVAVMDRLRVQFLRFVLHVFRGRRGDDDRPVRHSCDHSGVHDIHSFREAILRTLRRGG